jgi:hypothetical protein
MSPTVFRHGPYRFFFFSREEERPHVHVSCADGEAKFWIAPAVELAFQTGLSKKQVAAMSKLVEDHIDEIGAAWKKHFSR